MKITINDIYAAAAGLAIGYFAFKNKESKVGAANIEDSEEESLRLAIQLGMIKLVGPWEEKEATKGGMEFGRKLNQKLGPDSAEQRKELTEAINEGANSWIVDRISWLLNGSYGSELKLYMDRQIAMLNTSGTKAFKRSLDSYTKLTVLALITAEMWDINRAAIISAIKKANPTANEQLLDAAKKEIVDYYLEHTGYFDRK
jgi:hypothetical protein